MKLTIQYKLFFAMMASAMVLIGYMGLVFQWSFDKGFLEYIDTTEQEEITLVAIELEKHFSEHKNWDMLKAKPLLMARFHAQTLPDGKKKKFILRMLEKGDFPGWMLKPVHESKGKRPPHPMMRTIILDKDKTPIYGFKQGDNFPKLHTLNYQNRPIGYIGRYSPQIPADSHQLLFVKKQKLIMLMVVAAAIFITIGLSLPLAFHLTKPIRRLSKAARRLISGDYTTRITESSQDEIGQLSNDINTLAKTLEKNEIQREQWVNDIAHELRTPLTTLQGEIEAVQDGIRPPDNQTFSNLHQGVMRLNRLVEDLYDLSKSELAPLTYHFEELDLLQLIKDEATAKQFEIEKAGLDLLLETDTSVTTISGDKQRLQQLMGNLLNNAINYTDPGGTIKINMLSEKDKIVMNFIDTAPGVPEAALSHLFDRLFRVEESRNRAHGGSGLGLAICKKIVAAHQGTITVQQSPIGGLWVQVILPQYGEK